MNDDSVAAMSEYRVLTDLDLMRNSRTTEEEQKRVQEGRHPRYVQLVHPVSCHVKGHWPEASHRLLLRPQSTYGFQAPTSLQTLAEKNESSPTTSLGT